MIKQTRPITAYVQYSLDQNFSKSTDTDKLHLLLQHRHIQCSAIYTYTA